MKANLIFSENDQRSGYENHLVNLAKPEQEAPFNFSSLYDSNELEELVVHDALDYVEEKHKFGVLQHWLSLLRHGGQITLSFNEIEMLCQGFVNCSVSLEEFRSRTLETQSYSTAEEIRGFLESKGMKILKCRLHQNKAFITAQRP